MVKKSNATFPTAVIWRARNAGFADNAPTGVIADVRAKLLTLL